MGNRPRRIGLTLEIPVKNDDGRWRRDSGAGVLFPSVEASHDSSANFGDVSRASTIRSNSLAFVEPEKQVKLLLNKAKENCFRPFKNNIERQISLVLQLVEQGDLVLLAFSGHGAHFDGTSYLCPAEAKLDAATEECRGCRNLLKVAT